MDFGWSTDQRDRYDQTLKAVRDTFGERPPARSHFTREDWRRLGELGMLGLSVPAGYGGAGLDALDTARTVEALGRGCPDTGLVFAASAHLFACTMPIVDFGTEETRRELLPGLCAGTLIAGNAMTEAGAGSDVSSLAVTATEVPGGYRLNGEKSFVSNGPAADVLVTYATTDPAAGQFGLTAFAVDASADGVSAGDPFVKMGLTSCPAGPVRFTDCFVPAGRVLGEPGAGAAIFQHSMGWERACLFAGYVGLVDRLIDQAVAHAGQRRQFGQRLADFQSVSNRIVEMKLRVEGARLLLYRACWEMAQGRPATLSTALSKLAISEGAVASALDAVRVFGARGYLAADGIEAALRDSVPAMIFSGTSDIQRRLVAREMGL
ncbi:MAG: acyl-CoA dehydrogenase family protein [Nocardiopsaceae bacterium]|nr:acyl-CoA dehydrogenase family protein [Nocardiopsaceae bacterium]